MNSFKFKTFNNFTLDNDVKGLDIRVLRWCNHVVELLIDTIIIW